MKKGFVKGLTCLGMAGVMFGAAMGMSGCGNMDVMDLHYTFHYVVTEENNQHVLHKVKSWSDSEGESVTISTECCGNYLWTSANKAVLYENKPDESSYDFECNH